MCSDIRRQAFLLFACPQDPRRSLRRMNAAVKRPRWLASTALLAFVAALGGWRYRHWRDHRFEAVILVAAQRYGVQPALVKAVVWRESRFNPAVRGRKNEL